jgi:hypothetical protein
MLRENLDFAIQRCLPIATFNDFFSPFPFSTRSSS